MKRTLVILILLYCLGIILARLIPINFWLIIAISLFIFTAAILFSKDNKIFLFLVFVLSILGGMLSFKNALILPKCHISNFVYYKDNSSYSLTGFVDAVLDADAGKSRFILRVQQIQSENLKWACCGKVLVKADFKSNINYGDNLVLIGNLSRIPGFSPASRSYKNFLIRQDIYLTMRLRDARQLICQPGNSGSKLIRYSLYLRNRIEQIINSALGNLPAGILSAMVLGQKKDIPWLVNNTMVKSGTVHILVVSGFNVGIVSFIINLLLKVLRIRRRLRIILVIICLLIYCLVTGASNPVVRATIMGVFFLLAYIFKREPDIYNSLSLAALLILSARPAELFDVGFQLSFSSVLAIVFFYPKLKKLFRLKAVKIRLWKFICESFLVSLSAWLGTVCIIAFNFRIIAPVTVFANIFIVPLATVITLCGFVIVFCGAFLPALAGFISTPISVLINLLLSLNSAMVKVPFSYIYL